MSLPESFVLIDLETTGANSVTDRITEIALMRVERGEVVLRWETLVNPGRTIPAFIQRIIGITDAMVADAPTFAEVAEPLREMLDGAVFVAHNARFDYGFIRNEYARMGQEFEAPVLCTVKLSRALYPDFHRHGLDALIERHSFQCEARHRAMGDADVLWQLAQKVTRDFSVEALAQACARAMKAPPRPLGLPEGVLEGLPEAPGVYLFFGEQEAPLYVGRSASLRARVMEHFAALGRKGKEAELAAQVRKVDWIETAGELSAMLLEASLVKARRPRHNRMPSGGGDVFGLRVTPRRKRPPVLARVPLDGSDPATWEDVHGTFRSAKEADSVLHELARVYRLCPRRLGLEPGGQGACNAYQAKRCAGACVSRESGEAHDERLLGGLRSLGLKAWPWDGPVVVTERSIHNDAVAFHVFDQWCHLGSAESPEALADLSAELPARRFELDTYRLLQRWLGVPANLATASPL